MVGSNELRPCSADKFMQIMMKSIEVTLAENILRREAKACREGRSVECQRSVQRGLSTESILCTMGMLNTARRDI